MSTFALISPIGAGIGIALSETVESEASLQSSLVTILQGLATGTLLYVVFFEVIEKERQKKTNGILQVKSHRLKSSRKCDSDSISGHVFGPWISYHDFAGMDWIANSPSRNDFANFFDLHFGLCRPQMAISNEFHVSERHFGTFVTRKLSNFFK